MFYTAKILELYNWLFSKAHYVSIDGIHENAMAQWQWKEHKMICRIDARGNMQCTFDNNPVKHIQDVLFGGFVEDGKFIVVNVITGTIWEFDEQDNK